MERLPIPGWPGYTASSDGTIYSKRPSAKPMSAHPHKDGYMFVRPTRDGKRQAQSVHRLVAFAFIRVPKPGEVVRHLDGNRGHNNAANLAVGTPAENYADRDKHGTTARGSRNGWAKLNEEAVVEIVARLHAGESQDKVAASYAVNPSCISGIVNRKTWRHVTDGLDWSLPRRFGRKGVNNGRAKLTLDDVETIRSAYATGGVKQVDLAARYGVVQTTISKIVRRDHWLPEPVPPPEDAA